MSKEKVKKLMKYHWKNISRFPRVTDAEILEVIKKAEEEKDLYFSELKVFYETGIRWSELVALPLNALDDVNSELIISMGAHGDKIVCLRNPRAVKLSKELLTYFSDLKIKRQLAGEKLFFPDLSGKRRHFMFHFKDLFLRCYLHGVVLYDFRQNAMAKINQ